MSGPRGDQAAAADLELMMSHLPRGPGDPPQSVEKSNTMDAIHFYSVSGEYGCYCLLIRMAFLAGLDYNVIPLMITT
jgi:hypothetical protein